MTNVGPEKHIFAQAGNQRLPAAVFNILVSRQNKKTPFTNYNYRLQTSQLISNPFRSQELLEFTVRHGS